MVTVVLQQIKYCKIYLQYKGCHFEWRKRCWKKGVVAIDAYA